MIQLVCHKNQSGNLKRKMAPIEPTNQSLEPPGHTKNAYRPLSAMPGFHIARSMSTAGTRKWKTGCPCSQVPDRQTGRQNAEKK